ncbi:MAG: ATP phosphoribosyltransferase regulatory subunit [Collinsella sp.]
MTATPWGFRDILPEEAQAREEIALTVKGCFREHHYLPVETPLLEDKGSLEEGGRIADTPFKLFDDNGRLLVVRPDNTLPIVRLVSTRMRAADLPLRLRYEAPVVRECQRNAGGSRQFTQLGFELIGAGDTTGDVEIVSLVAEAVRKLALPDARIIAGSVRPFRELLAACGDRELAAEALRCVHANDFVGLDARVAAEASRASRPSRLPLASVPACIGGVRGYIRLGLLLNLRVTRRAARTWSRTLSPEDASGAVLGFSIMNSLDAHGPQTLPA